VTRRVPRRGEGDKVQNITNLEHENRQVLALLQAVMGRISTNMRVIALVPRGREATLKFLLEEESNEDREEIDDMLFEYQSYWDSFEDCEVNAEVVVIGNRNLTHEDGEGRLIYVRKRQNWQ
jgi:hypothetical protein